MPDEAEVAKKIMDKVFVGLCENFIDNLPDNHFDAIYFNDVLKHLFDSYSLLNKLKSKLLPKGVIISSIPNMRYHNEIFNLLVKKDWKYEQHGIIDFTHLRFFTGKSIRRMYEDAGYVVKINEGINRTKSIRP